MYNHNMEMSQKGMKSKIEYEKLEIHMNKWFK